MYWTFRLPNVAHSAGVIGSLISARKYTIRRACTKYTNGYARDLLEHDLLIYSYRSVAKAVLGIQ